MSLRYSQPLLELAASKPNEIKQIETFLVSFILDRYLSRNAAQSQILQFDAILIPHVELIHHLVQCYGLSSRNAAEQCSILVMHLEDQTPDIPKCSAFRFAKSQSQLQEDATKSNKYSQSKLRIDRSTALTEATGANLVSKSNMGIIPNVSDLVCTCIIEDDAFASRKTRYSALCEEDEEIRGKEISPLEVCSVCLDPLLQVSRALKGESLTVLKCKHVLHSACAHEVRAYKAGASIGRVVGNSSLVPDLGPLRCPICRCESINMIEVSLTLVTKEGRPVPIQSVVSTIGPASTRKKGKKKNIEESDSDLIEDLLLMGFEESAIRDEISRTGDDKVLAINNLLSSAY